MRRKTLEQHKLDGTYRADRHAHLVAMEIADGTEPPPQIPGDLPAAERAKWEELVPRLQPPLKQRDVSMFVELCRWLVRADRFAESLSEYLTTDTAAAIPPKLLTFSAIATDKIALLSQRFGLSPADRTKIVAEIAKKSKPKVRARGE